MSNDYTQSFEIVFTNPSTSTTPPSGWVSASFIYAIAATFTAGESIFAQYGTYPTNASSTDVSWYMTNQNGTDAAINQVTGEITASTSGSCYIKVVLNNSDGIGGSISSDAVKITINADTSSGGGNVPGTGNDVTGITIYSASTDAETFFEIGADVQPWNATNTIIRWAIVNDRSTGATINASTGIFYSPVESPENEPIIISATITNGKINTGEDFVAEFEIVVNAVGASLGTGATINKTSGHVGYIYSDPSYSPEDSDGAASKAVFVIPFVSGSYYSVTAFDGYNAWKVRTPNDTLIVCKNPTILNTNRTSMMLELDTVYPYPSNSPVTLVYGTDQAKLIMSNQDDADPFATNQMIGATGYTFSDNYTDVNGLTDKVLFVFRYTAADNLIFTVNGGNSDWSVRLPDNSYVNLSDAVVLRTNKDSTIVQFTMSSSYPSNSPAALCRRTESASYTYAATGSAITVTAGTLSGFMGYTSVYNLDGDLENSDGEVSTFIANFIFSVQSYTPIFALTGSWAVKMANGEIINLTYDSNSYIFTNTDSVVVRFKMAKSFPSNVQGMLLYNSADAGYTMQAGDGSTTFIPVQQIDNIPDTITTYTDVCLDYDVSIAPINATNQTIIWSISSTNNTANATIDNDTNIVYSETVGKFQLNATIEYGLVSEDNTTTSNKNYTISKWVTTESAPISITTQPEVLSFVVYGKIAEKLTVAASGTGTLSYAWYSNTSNLNINGTNTGQTGQTFTIPSGLAGDAVYYYYCVITSSLGGTTTSNVAAVRCDIEATSISLTPNNQTIITDDVLTLTPVYSPSNTTLTSLTWSSSDTSKATVDVFGNVTAQSTGGAVSIYATASNGIKGTATLTVEPFVPVDSLVNMTYTAIIDQVLTLTPTVMPLDASYQDITWTITNDYGNTVSLNGNQFIFTALGTSSAVCTIRATIANGAAIGMSWTKTYAITLSTGFQAVSGMDMNTLEVDLNVPTTLSYEVFPYEATNKNVTWSVRSGDPNIIGATFNGDIITCTGSEGSAWIDATIINGTTADGTNWANSYQIYANEAFNPVDTISGIPSSISQNSDTVITFNVNGQNGGTATYTNVNWSISNNSISASIKSSTDNTVTLYASKTGSFTLNATIENGSVNVDDEGLNGVDYTNSWTISVSKFTQLEDFDISTPNGETSIAPGESIQLSVVMDPTDADAIVTSWSINSASTATGTTITNNGLLTAGSVSGNIIIDVELEDDKQ